MKTLQNLISTSKWCVKHPFPGPNMWHVRSNKEGRGRNQYLKMTLFVNGLSDNWKLLNLFLFVCCSNVKPAIILPYWFSRIFILNVTLFFHWILFNKYKVYTKASMRLLTEYRRIMVPQHQNDEDKNYWWINSEWKNVFTIFEVYFDSNDYNIWIWWS